MSFPRIVLSLWSWHLPSRVIRIVSSQDDGFVFRKDSLNGSNDAERTRSLDAVLEGADRTRDFGCKRCQSRTASQGRCIEIPHNLQVRAFIVGHTLMLSQDAHSKGHTDDCVSECCQVVVCRKLCRALICGNADRTTDRPCRQQDIYVRHSLLCFSLRVI